MNSSNVEGVRILILEDNPADARLAFLKLEDAGLKVDGEVACNSSEFLERIRSNVYDAILCDYRLPGWSGLDALRSVRASDTVTPFIFVSGTLGEELAVECIKEGATDYVLKGNLERLPVAVRRALLDRKLQEKNVELVNTNQAKDRFLSMMSHELRTPLTAIIGFTGTLLMRLAGPLTSDQEKQLRIIQTSARHLFSLISDILDLAKIESGKVQLRLEPLPYASILEEVAETLRPQVEVKGLKFELLLPAGDAVVLADRRALIQILTNLMSNAIKFTEKGWIRLEANQKFDNGAKRVEISVIDTGIGIRSDDQAKLFQEFSRVEGEGTRRPDGAGLGLYLCKRLADLLGGRILLESEYGKGSRFTLVLPKQ